MVRTSGRARPRCGCDRKEVAFGELPSGHRAVVPGRPGTERAGRRILSTDPTVHDAGAGVASLADRLREGGARPLGRAGRGLEAALVVHPAAEARGAARSDTRPGRAARSIGSCSRRSSRRDSRRRREATARDVAAARDVRPHGTAARRWTRSTPSSADRAPDAYEKVVDRLLASPAYGERMAADWLDVARYADSHGYQDDGMREMWPWRDWVISRVQPEPAASTSFITWQLAGDLLPEADRGAAARDRLQPEPHADPGRRRRPGGVPHRVRRRSREHVRARVPRPERRVRAVPRPQVRPDHAEGVLPALRFFNSINETGQIPYSGVPSPTVVARGRRRRARSSRRSGARCGRWNRQPTIGALRYDAPATRTGCARTTTAAGPARSATLPGTRRAPAARRQLTVIGARDGEAEDADRGAGRSREVRAFANLAPGAKDRLPRRRQGPRPEDASPVMSASAQQLVGDSHIEIADKSRPLRAQRAVLARHLVRLEGRARRVRSSHARGGLFNGNRGYEIILRKDGTLTRRAPPRRSRQLDRDRDRAAARAWRRGTTWRSRYDGSSRAAGLRLFLDGTLAADAGHRRSPAAKHRPRAATRRRTGRQPARCASAAATTRRLPDVSVDELRRLRSPADARSRSAGLAGDHRSARCGAVAHARRRTRCQRAALARAVPAARRAPGLRGAAHGAHHASAARRTRS